MGARARTHTDPSGSAVRGPRAAGDWRSSQRCLLVRIKHTACAWDGRDTGYMHGYMRGCDRVV